MCNSKYYRGFIDVFTFLFPGQQIYDDIFPKLHLTIQIMYDLTDFFNAIAISRLQCSFTVLEFDFFAIYRVLLDAAKYDLNY